MFDFIPGARVSFDRMTEGDKLDYLSAKRTVASAKRVAANMASNGYFKGARDAKRALNEARRTMRTIEARYA